MKVRNSVLLTVFAAATFLALGSRSADAQVAFGGRFAGRHGDVSVNHSRFGGRGFFNRPRFRDRAFFSRPQFRARRFFVAFPFPHFVVRRVDAGPYCGY